jgi:D-alanine-D-alanine ligase-like ATP-grasp enzyme
MLRATGVNCPAGDEFLLPWWHKKIMRSRYAQGDIDIKTTDHAPAYIEQQLGYPVYVKPVDGSKGSDIFVVHTPAELETIFELYNEKRIRVAMVEAPVNMPDYRIISLDGELISAYRRIPLTVVGDGTNNIRQLVNQLQTQYEQQGRDMRLDADDERIRRHLAQQNITLQDVPALGQALPLMPISNLSTGGTSEDVTDIISKRWTDLAAKVGEDFSLRLLGLDLACDDITSADANYSVLEVNAAPGLDHYALSGDAHMEQADRLYAKVLNAFPARN